MNHEKYHERLNLVRSAIVEFGLEDPARIDSFPNPGPYTTPPPDEGVSTIVLRLANPKAQDIIQDNRVENEVAAMYLARQGLLAFKPEAAGLIPAVYAWKSHQGAGEGYSWTLMEYKEGVPLDTKFPGLSDEEQKDVLGQIADVFTGIQQAPLPESIKSHGGLTIDGSGRIVGGKMTILEGAPWASYGDFWRTRLAFRLKDAEESPALQGWKPNGVRERVDGFLSAGLETYLASSGVDETKRVLIHGDLTTNNIQYDPESKKITGVLDFDWAYVSHPCHEFFTSLGDLGGSTGGGTARDPDLSGGRLGKAMLAGDFDIPDLPAGAARQLTRARAWDDALAARGALRPSAISGVVALDRLSKLEALLGPFALTHPVMLKRRTAEQIAETRRATETQLVECLESFGY